LDQAIAGLEEVLLVLLGGQDVGGELLDPVTDYLRPDGVGEGVATQGDQLLGLILTESGPAMGVEDGGDPQGYQFVACGPAATNSSGKT
jgi:hypothetical protein